jgi:broad specificity phosphatase PhoE
VREAALLVHLVIVAAGVGVLVASTPSLFDTIRYAGAAYLVYLGVRQFLARQGADTDAVGDARLREPAWSMFRRGLLVNLPGLRPAVRAAGSSDAGSARGLGRLTAGESGQRITNRVFGSLFVGVGVPYGYCNVDPGVMLTISDFSEALLPLRGSAGPRRCGRGARVRSLYLVRHGRPTVDPSLPASEWILDPGHEDDVVALGVSGGLPGGAAWFTSPEPKAARTAELLAGRQVGVVHDLREHDRTAGWVEDFPGTVAEAFARPDEVVHDGWEPLTRTRQRVGAAVRRILAEHVGRDVVLVGHGTAWTLLVAELTGAEPDLDRWRGLSMPDVIVVEY